MGPDEQVIHGVHSAWIAAVNSGDLARLLSLMTDDVVFLNPGQAPVGRDGFSPGFSAAHQQSRIRCTSELEEVVVVGDVAYTRARDSLSVTPRDGGAAVHLAGRPARLTLTKLAENAFRAELARLKALHNGGEDFPPRDEELRGGRPIAA